MDLDTAIRTVEHRPAAYVLCGSDGNYHYKGACRDLVERMKHHRAGLASRTKNRRPLNLVYFDYCSSYSEALKRENFLKSGQGRQWLNEHLQ
ncbi:MAG: GIY-YIG nuclease family protein [Lentisphaerae bacterium]|nr:GIY-YIG nuclease family protein [Lentisphaerota bacterium]